MCSVADHEVIGSGGTELEHEKCTIEDIWSKYGQFTVNFGEITSDTAKFGVTIKGVKFYGPRHSPVKQYKHLVVFL